MELTIDREFQKIAPPLKAAELDMLKENLLERGCLEPILIWGGIIVDGHNRYRICREYDIPFKVQEMNFRDRDEAKVWIAKNQLGRRNLTAFQRCEMVLPLEAEIKADANKRRQAGVKLEGVTKGNTRDILAEMAGVSHFTMDTVKVILQRGDEETIRRVRSGAVSINWAYRSLDGLPLTPKPKNSSSLIEINEIISTLIGKVSGGDASPRAIINELERVSTLLKDEMRR